MVKEHAEWIVNSPSISMNVPSVLITSDYIKWNRHIKYNRNNVLLRDDYTCQYCGDTPTHVQLTLDHVVPKSHGGKTTWKNVSTSCKPCNSRKGNNASIVPKKTPHRPSYYELAAKRLKQPVRIRDEYWLNYIDWPSDLITLNPYTKTEI